MKIDQVQLAKYLLIASLALSVAVAFKTEAAEVVPFVSGSMIHINETDWLTPDYEKGHYVKPSNMATLKAGVAIKENNLTVDINLFHISDPTNGQLGRLNEGDYGANGWEVSTRYEFK